jgi:2-succinyl-5-enolpyruvyl-6-hydroxy-3-cyclohexene-1-carboxylate synthase
MDAQATFCATLVDEWVRAGITDAVVAPGSRSTPMALALARRSELTVHVHHDERSAGFVGLGLGLASGRPAIVLTTSGTATTELHNAVVEAHQAHVPMVVCTADRPPELQHVGAPQTIDQSHLYGRAVRWHCDAGVPDGTRASTWRSLAARAALEATGWPPGPVHLNLPFRDPLTADADALPTGAPDGQPWHRAAGTTTGLSDRELLALIGKMAGRRGLIVAGGGAGDPSTVHALARVLGWPVLADPRSGCRLPRPTTVAHADALLRSIRFAGSHRPQVVLRLGAPPASKVVGEWLAAPGALHVMVAPPGAWWDPDHTAAIVCSADPTALCRQLTSALEAHGAAADWMGAWRAADDAASRAIARVLAAHREPTEPGTARDVVAALPDGASLVVSSSMPVRDVEWYAEPRAGLRTFANRGANGIDGVVSTAVGVALASGKAPTAALVGDIAFLHDANGLLGATGRDIDLTVVVVDNDGGGIFSFLPQAHQIPTATFERLFGTPHGVKAEELAAAHGIASLTIDDPAALVPAIRSTTGSGGVWVVVVRTDRRANVGIHDELNGAVGSALHAHDR